MKALDVLKIFRIPATKLISHKDVEKWKAVLKNYRDFKEQEVQDELTQVIQLCGSDRPLFYYLAAVRRRILDKRHHESKSYQMPQSIRQLFR